MKRIMIVFAVFSALLFIQAANAATVHFSSPAVADSITDLDVNGTLYDVNFIYGSLASIGASLDFTSFAEAQAAMSALATELTGASVSEVHVPGSGDFYYFSLAYAFDGSTLAYAYVENTDWSLLNLSSGACLTCGLYIADFTEVAAVPLPAGGLLLLTGVAGLAGLQRRRLKLS